MWQSHSKNSSKDTRCRLALTHGQDVAGPPGKIEEASTIPRVAGYPAHEAPGQMVLTHPRACECHQGKEPCCRAGKGR